MVNVGHYLIKNLQNEKVQGVFIDRKVNFQYQIEILCTKVSRKLQASALVVPNVETVKETLMNSFSFLVLSTQLNKECFKNLNQVCFEKKFHENLLKIDNSFEQFQNAFYCTLDCFALLKRKQFVQNMISL